MICLTILALPGKVEAQPADTEAAAKSAAAANEEYLKMLRQAVFDAVRAERVAAFKEEYLKMLRAELVNRQNQLINAKLELETIMSKEKAAPSFVIPPESLTALVNKDAVVTRTQKAIADLEQEVAAFKNRTPQPENEPRYKKDLDLIASHQKAVEARTQKIRPELENQLRQMYRDSVSTSLRLAEDRVNFLTKAEKTVQAKYQKAAEEYQEAEKAADLAGKLDEARREVKRARAEVEALRVRLEQEREKAVQAEREARAQRDAALQAAAVAQRRAEEALAAEAAARQEAAKRLSPAEKNAHLPARATALKMLAQDEFAKRKEQETPAGSKFSAADFDRAKARKLKEFDLKREELMAQLKHLDEEQQRMLARLEEKVKDFRRLKAFGEPAGGPPHPGMLDQILERLQRMEMRLDRLERGQPDAPPRQKR